MEKFIVTGASFNYPEELEMEKPQVFSTLLEAREAMIGNVILDLEDLDFYAANQQNGTKILYKDSDCAIEIGSIGRLSSYVWLSEDNFYSTYEIITMEV